MILLAAFVALAVILMLPVSRAGSQGTPEAATASLEARVAAAAAVEYSRLEAIGDYNGLYDRIHPDAHAVIPRAAAVGWFEEAFGTRGPGVATVTDVSFGAWTWPVTGQTYPNTAFVSFTQPFADGSITRDIVRLVQDQSGEWRWFFGRSRAFVDDQIARYVPALPQVEGLRSTVDVTVADLDTFWAATFATAGHPYRAPEIRALDASTTSGCGMLDPLQHSAVYCASDKRIYYAESFLSEQEFRYGDYAWIHIFAHEWAHHVQYSMEPGRRPSKAFELQADCLAGVYARDAGTRRLLEPGDITHAVMVSVAYSDDPRRTPIRATSHGASDERILAFVMGYLDGFIGCEFPIAADTAEPDDTRTASTAAAA